MLLRIPAHPHHKGYNPNPTEGLGFHLLTFDLLTSGSVHAEVLPWTTCLPTLVLRAQAVFLLKRGQTYETERATPRRRG